MEGLLEKSKKIGEGRNSSVYLLEESSYDQPVVVKVLKDEYNFYPHTSLLTNEHEHLLKANHEGVRKSIDFVDIKNKKGLVLPYFEGQTLSERFAESKVTIVDAIAIAIKICNALLYVHQQDIIHKDLNPFNILMNQSGQINLIDFGLASTIDTKLSPNNLSNELKGSLQYISPEQTGRTNHFVDQRSDLYSFGVILYELLSGQLPFTSTHPMELVHSHLAISPEPLSKLNSEVPGILSDIVSKLLKKEVEERYQSAYGLLTDLEKCHDQLNLKIKIDRFNLAENDQSGKLLISSKLYGREAEVGKLLDSFEMLEKGKKVVALIKGSSGTGKTSLVYEIYKPVTAKKAHFIQGKHVQFQQDIPYQAIAQSIKEFVETILVKTEKELEYWKNLLLKAVGAEGELITRLAPSLELVIGKQKKVSELGLNESKNRFNYTFSKVIKAIATDRHPLVMFIDDLQWADSASLELIKTLLSDQELEHFFFIGAYRDNEVDAAHPAALTFIDIEKSGVSVKVISTGELASNDVNLLIQDTFSCSPTKAKELTKLVYEKTVGNPFFINQFIRSMYEQGFVKFNHNSKGGGAWDWNIEEMSKMNFTDNVVEFMLQKIRALDRDTQEILMLASCVGGQFDLGTLVQISDQTAGYIKKGLWNILKEQLIVATGDNSDFAYHTPSLKSTEDVTELSLRYKFTHDRIRQAAYKLTPENERSQLHQKIGQLWFENSDIENQEEHVFDIVFHLNQGATTKDSRISNKRLSELNYKAGMIAKKSSANQTALNYLESAIEMLPSDSWETDRSFCWELFNSTMQCAFLVGDYGRMNELGNIIFANSLSVYEEVEAHRTIIFSLVAQNQFKSAITHGLKILGKLGIKFPESPSKGNIILGLLGNKILMIKKDTDFFEKLPAMEDQKAQSLINLIVSFASAAYHKQPQLFPLVVFKLLSLSIKYGTSDESIPAYGGYGILMCGVTGEIDLGYRFGELSLNLLDKHPDSRGVAAKTYVIFTTFINHWKKHLKESLDLLMKSYYAAMETGDQEYAAASLFMHSYHAYFTGENLNELVPRVKSYAQKTGQLQQQSYGLYSSICCQGILNLYETVEDPSVLSGDFFNEKTFFEESEEQERDNTAYFHIYFNKMFLSFSFERYQEAVQYCEILDKNLEVAVSTVFIPTFYFYDSLCRLATYEESIKGVQKSILKRVKSNQKKLKKWSHHAPMNFSHKYHLVEAELSAANNGGKESSAYFEKSINEASENDYINELALAYELAGKYFGKTGDKVKETQNLKKAYETYKQWGALGKTKYMESLYAQLLMEPTSRPLQSVGNSINSMDGAPFLDLSTILKAASTISSELQLSKVIPQLLQITIENAGAQKGVFLLMDKEKLVAHAKGLANAEIGMIENSELNSEEFFPSSIIQFVQRTKDTIVLDEAIADHRFASDDYIVSNEVRSILCHPILHHGELLGVIYLENNLIKGGFTIQRIDTLKLLSGQIAVTLNNALLYDNLEQKVIERTQKIEEQKELLNQQNTDLQQINKEKDYLISVVSHDLRSPLYAIRNFVNLAGTKLSKANAETYIEPIIESIDRQDEVITRILDVSAINAQSIELKSELIDLNDALKSVIMNFKSLADNKEIAFGFESNLEKIEIELDENYLVKIVENLVSNAIKFTDPKGKVIVKSNLEESLFSITIKDNGPGINDQDQQLLFTQFRKLTPTPTADEKSTGLGLSIVKKYVKEMNGKIRCESELGKGTSFIVEFPLRF
ncbi:MAG: AAA family ATPase [Cyclobacteriaceae bacterium]